MINFSTDTAAFLEELERCANGPEAPYRVKGLLEQTLPNGLSLPARFFAPNSEHYSRHLLARFSNGVTAIVMVWGEGQATPLHDHAGIWCVEGVVKGRIKVTRYELLGGTGDRLQFQQGEEILAGVGSSGALIPPVEHHTIANTLDQPSATIHVYGGEMNQCKIFLPLERAGYYRPQMRSLLYTTAEPLVG